MNRALSLVLVFAASTVLSDEFRYLDFKMLHSDADPFRVWIDDRGGAPISVVESEVALLNALQTWDTLACASTGFRYQGHASDGGIVDPASTGDAFSVAAIWVTSAADPAYTSVLGGGVAAAAALPVQHGGVLETCDIFLNAVDHAWSTDSAGTPSGALDLETLLLHELGHCQGLDHTMSPRGTVMDPALPFGAQRRTLSPHDAEHLCRHSPLEGAVGSPCDSAGECTNGLSCLTPPNADGGTGTPFCTRACVDEDCPFPFACRETTQLSGATQACLSITSGNVTRVGAACMDDSECGSDVGLCRTEWLEGYCTESCASPDSSSCPAGAACSDGACLQRCRPGYGGCRDGYVCDYARDDVPLCRSSCVADGDCGAGERCRTCDGACVASEVSSIEMGVRCDGSNACPLGRVCLALPGAPEGLCVQPCETACTACPEGSVCARLGGAGERFCLSSCEGGCPVGTLCSALAEGSACLPGCQSDLECPVGNVCEEGACNNPFARDAGTSEPGPPEELPPPKGCGCHTGAAGSWLALFASLILFGVRRR